MYFLYKQHTLVTIYQPSTFCPYMRPGIHTYIHTYITRVVPCSHATRTKCIVLQCVAVSCSPLHLVSTCVLAYIQPIADRVAQHLEIISKNFQFSTRRTKILMGFIMYCLAMIVNPMGRILVRWKSFRNNLEMQCRPICIWLYMCVYIYLYILYNLYKIYK